MRLREILCCPQCKGELRPEAIQRGAERTEGCSFFCARCNVVYRAVDGVPDFLPEDTAEKGRGQKLMECERIVEIYEGKWWRGGRIFALFMGISLDNEMALVNKIADIGPADTVLDLACGPGLYARAFAKDGPQRRVVGLDCSWPMLRYAVRKARSLGIENVAFLHGDAHYLPFKDASFEAANCCGALHLFSDVGRVLGELGRVIKPGGRFSMALAMRTSKPLNRLKAYLAGRYWRVRFFREDELKTLLDEAGFEPAIYHARRIWMIAGGVRRP